MSRRDLFERFIGRLRPPVQPSSGRETAPSPREAQKLEPTHVGCYDQEIEQRVAVIQGRFCIALTSFCTVCVERCPVPGAMIKSQGLPQVVADCCTGCGICQEVCPAPRNAVLMIPTKRSAGERTGR